MIEGGPLDARLARLRAAADAAASIGLTSTAARATKVADRVAQRAGFGGSVYVLALAGGTGVGKSSVLNALAGRTVSPARAVRPTTQRPVGWVAERRRDEVQPLLSWLDVEHVITHADPSLADVAILDLPDVDSVRGEHRRIVDALLPRIDSIAWVVDPEKYDDERMHAYWRSLAQHADRLRFILNKADRLTDAQRGAVADDLRARLVSAGIPRPVIHVVSAASGDGIDAMREQLADAAGAKIIVAAKLEADVTDASHRMARAAGIDPDEGYRPLLPDERREAMVNEAVTGALTLVDPPGLARQIRSAVLHRARAGGGSLLGRVIAIVASLTGQKARRADPAAYLRAWRNRGALGRVLNPMRGSMTAAAERLPAASRGEVLASMGAPSAERDLERLLDRTTASEAGSLEVPRSLLWPIIGAVQLVVGAVLVFALAWIVVLFVAGGGVPVGVVDAPLVGPIPMPLAILVGAVLVSAILGWLLGLHAGWIGRRLARKVAARTEESVRAAVSEGGFSALARIEEARRTIATSLVQSG